MSSPEGATRNSIQGRRVLMLGIAIAIGSAALFRISNPFGATTPSSEAGLYAAFCSPPPEAARISSVEPVAHVIAASVPADTPTSPLLDGQPTRPIRMGEAVEFIVSSPREGALAVHGLSDLVLVDTGDAVRVRFRAIYSGRFPLHFHGADGSHFEIAVLEIR